jgi:hypothetical protein
VEALENLILRAAEKDRDPDGAISEPGKPASTVLTPGFLKLPYELNSILVEHMDPASIMALASTSRAMFEAYACFITFLYLDESLQIVGRHLSFAKNEDKSARLKLQPSYPLRRYRHFALRGTLNAIGHKENYLGRALITAMASIPVTALSISFIRVPFLMWKHLVLHEFTALKQLNVVKCFQLHLLSLPESEWGSVVQNLNGIEFNYVPPLLPYNSLFENFNGLTSRVVWAWLIRFIGMIMNEFPDLLKDGSRSRDIICLNLLDWHFEKTSEKVHSVSLLLDRLMQAPKLPRHPRTRPNGGDENVQVSHYCDVRHEICREYYELHAYRVWNGGLAHRIPPNSKRAKYYVCHVCRMGYSPGYCWPKGAGPQRGLCYMCLYRVILLPYIFDWTKTQGLHVVDVADDDFPEFPFEGSSEHLPGWKDVMQHKLTTAPNDSIESDLNSCALYILTKSQLHVPVPSETSQIDRWHCEAPALESAWLAEKLDNETKWAS